MNLPKKHIVFMVFFFFEEVFPSLFTIFGVFLYVTYNTLRLRIFDDSRNTGILAWHKRDAPDL
jgi:hypothetical protein